MQDTDSELADGPVVFALKVAALVLVSVAVPRFPDAPAPDTDDEGPGEPAVRAEL